MNPHTPKKHVHIQLSITFYKPLQMCEHILRHADPALPLMVAAFVFLPKTLAFDSHDSFITQPSRTSGE